MSVLIKGIEMPKSCYKCFWILEKGCPLKPDQVMPDERPENCPLIPIQPHGRLIDADALPKYTGYALSAVEVASAVENASAIIQADLAKEGE